MDKERENIDLTSPQRTTLVELLERYIPNTEVWAYGSRVKFTAKSYSDLDLVAFTTAEQKSALFALKEAFEESDLPFRVDLFCWDDIPEQFQKNIKQEKTILQYGSMGCQPMNKGESPLLPENNEWSVVSIDEIKDDKKGAIAIGPFGSRMKSDCYVENGVPVIRGTNITGGATFEKDFVYITEDKADELGSSNVYQNDLVFPHRGSIGEVGIVLKDERYVISSSLMKLTCNPSKANPKFLYYFFRSYLGRHELLKNASQVGTPGIGQPLTSLKSIELKLPPLKTQNQIVAILTSLDKKIELNKKINQTLEQMAQALFKSWFVDFDPVRAKMIVREAGGTAEQANLAAMQVISSKTEAQLEVMKTQQPEQYKELKATAELFPDAMQESELGEVPVGWEVKKLLDIAINYRKSIKPSTLPDEIPYIGLEHIDRKCFSLNKCGMASDIDSQKSEFKSGDFLFGKLRPYFHKVCYPSFSGICSTDILVIRAKEIELSGIVGCLIFQEEFIEFANRSSTGTRMPRANWKDMSSYAVALPQDKLIKQFNKIALSFWGNSTTNVLQNQSLTQLRDTLLPKLLSGELSLKKKEINVL